MGIKEGPYWITTHPSGRKEGEKQATIYQMKNAEFFFLYHMWAISHLAEIVKMLFGTNENFLVCYISIKGGAIQ